MHKHRLYFADICKDDTRIILRDHAFNYLKNVLRLRENDNLYLFNNIDGLEYKGSISRVEKRSLDIIIVSKKTINNELPIEVNLYCAPIKNNNFDLVVQKSSELGIKSIIPIKTKRVTKHLIAKDFSKRIGRLQKISNNASEQCGRVFVTKINDLLDFQNIQTNNNNDEIFIILSPYSKNNINKINIDGLKTINIIIGPEGGFSDSEIKLATNEKSIQDINIGPRVLRAETVPIFIGSIFNFLSL